MDVRKAIIDAAERRIRMGGYNGFSFREIAAKVGVKSASVHYYFPVKADLAIATAQRHNQRFYAALGPADDSRSPQEKLQHFLNLYRSALDLDGCMCFCGILALEISGLPELVAKETGSFFAEILAWLETAVGELVPAADAMVIAEGALVFVRTR